MLLRNGQSTDNDGQNAEEAAGKPTIKPLPLTSRRLIQGHQRERWFPMMEKTDDD